jgi:hypothetical protein
MENIKLTKSAIYTQMIAYFNGEDTEMTPEAMATFCANEKAIIDKKAAKAKETAAAKKETADALCDAVLAVMTSEPMSRDTITSLVNDPEATVAKVGSRLNKLAAMGKVVKGESKAEGKGRKIVTYALAD